MGRGGHKIKREQTCWRQCLILRPKRRQKGTGDKQCRAESPSSTFCLEKQQLSSGQVPIKKYNCALMIFTQEAFISHHERSGGIVSLIYNIFSLFTLLFKKTPQVSHIYESAKTHGISQNQTNMTTNSQGKKECLDKDAGHWETKP